MPWPSRRRQTPGTRRRSASRRYESIIGVSARTALASAMGVATAISTVLAGLIAAILLRDQPPIDRIEPPRDDGPVVRARRLQSARAERAAKMSIAEQRQQCGADCVRVAGRDERAAVRAADERFVPCDAARDDRFLARHRFEQDDAEA